MSAAGKTAAAAPRPFLHNILRLSVGDFVFNALNFLVFVYLARVVGVNGLGILGFAIALTTYSATLADAGLSAWGAREAAQTSDLSGLVHRVVPLRLVLAAGTFGLLMALLPFLPKSSEVRTVIALYGLTLFSQAVSLRWAFLGTEQMNRLVAGLCVAQLVFVAAVLAFVRGPSAIVWVPVFRFAGDLAMAAYLWRLFARALGRPASRWTLKGAREILPPALTMGASQMMGLLSYNFDSLLLGFLTSVRVVGLYTAAYRPVNAALAFALSYSLGLFPALSRSFAEGPKAFSALVWRSTSICSIFAFPVGIGGILLAVPVTDFLYGPAYRESVAPLRILAGSVIFSILRTTFRQALRAAHHQNLELRGAAAAAAANVGLNLLLIPRYGIVGAAWATFAAEGLSLAMNYFYFRAAVLTMNVVPLLVRPIVASAVMGAALAVGEPVFWMVRAVLAGSLYFVVLFLLGDEQIRWWVRLARQSAPRLGRSKTSG